MTVQIFNGCSITWTRATSVDDTLQILQQILDTWPDAQIRVFGSTWPIPLSELATLPEQPSYVVYRDHATFVERERPAGRPDPSAWIRLQIEPERITFVIDSWGSASGRIVRRIVGIDR